MKPLTPLLQAQTACCSSYGRLLLTLACFYICIYIYIYIHIQMFVNVRLTFFNLTVFNYVYFANAL